MSQKSAAPSLEARLQPWIDQAEYIIVLTLAIMAWSAGWVDLFAYESGTPTIFGRYSLIIFAALVLYTLGFGIWFYLIFSLNALERLKRLLAYIQRTPPVALLVGVLLIGIAASTWFVVYWTWMPLLQGAILTIVLLFAVMLLAFQPDPTTPFQRWRKVVLGIIGLFVLVEAVLYGLAYAGVLPLQNTTGLFEPYGRVYQNQEGHTLDTTNRFGWYYPDFAVDAGKTNIVLNGDSFVQGLQVPRSAHMGVALQERIADESVQVIGMGQPGYGPSVYLNPELYGFVWSQVEMDEMIVFFHLANDFQVVTEPGSARPYMQIDDEGRVALHPQDSVHNHALLHVVFGGHEAPALLESVFTHSFLFSWTQEAFRTTFAPPPHPGQLKPVPYSFQREIVPYYDVTPHIASRSPQQPFGAASFMFETQPDDRAEDAYTVAFTLLSRLNSGFETEGIAMRLVTIPFFPEAFYEAETGTDWDARIDGYDPLLPEQRLAEFAEEQGIPFLGMGAYLQAQERDNPELQSLFFGEGVGHLTEAGHETFGEAVYACFYQTAEQPPAGCDARPVAIADRP